MISIIVSSYKDNSYNEFEKSVSVTIGVPYEIIKISNPGLMGICEAYNRGAERSKYDCFLFAHDDIIFNTQNWGQLLLAHLKDSSTGAIGVAGGKYKSSVPSSWSIIEKQKAVNVMQHHKDEKESPSRILIKHNNEEKSQVVVLDGVFIATRKEVWRAFQFDESKLKGFHGYDIDFSLAVAQKFKIYVVYDILIEHFSEGNPDKNWILAAQAVSDKWKHILPISSCKLTKQEQKEYHNKVLRNYIYKLRMFSFSRVYIFYNALKYSFRSFFNYRFCIFMLKVLK